MAADPEVTVDAPATWQPSMMQVPWVESPFFEQLLEESGLGPEDRELAREFSDQGYLVIDTGIPDETIQAVIDGLSGTYGLVQSSYDTRIMDANHPAVQEIATWPRVFDVLRLLYGREPIPFQTLNFEVGTQQAVHNDAIHFHCIPHRFMCGVWVALEDTDSDNGPLFYYPGSHKLPIYEMPDLGLASGTDSYNTHVQALQALMRLHGLEPKELHARKGQALIWAANLHHGGSPVNDANRTRLSQVTHYYFSDCLYYSPQGTDLVEGRLQLRNIRDLRTQRMVPHVHLGRVLFQPTEPGEHMLELGGGAPPPPDAPTAPHEPPGQVLAEEALEPEPALPPTPRLSLGQRVYWRIRMSLRRLRR
jgi:phytanoyl-CoA dioxygenase PhyH